MKKTHFVKKKKKLNIRLATNQISFHQREEQGEEEEKNTLTRIIM